MLRPSLCRSRLRTKLILAIGMTLGIAHTPVIAQVDRGAASAEQARPEEPTYWKTVRDELTSPQPSGSTILSSKPWIFVRGMTSEELNAAEYLAEPTEETVEGEPAVRFVAAVLLKQPQKDEGWAVREQTMRALCDSKQLQILDEAGRWSGYRARNEPAAQKRIDWICQLP